MADDHIIVRHWDLVRYGPYDERGGPKVLCVPGQADTFEIQRLPGGVIPFQAPKDRQWLEDFVKWPAFYTPAIPEWGCIPRCVDYLQTFKDPAERREERGWRNRHGEAIQHESMTLTAYGSRCLAHIAETTRGVDLSQELPQFIPSTNHVILLASSKGMKSTRKEVIEAHYTAIYVLYRQLAWVAWLRIHVGSWRNGLDGQLAHLAELNEAFVAQEWLRRLMYEPNYFHVNQSPSINHCIGVVLHHDVHPNVARKILELQIPAYDLVEPKAAVRREFVPSAPERRVWVARGNAPEIWGAEWARVRLPNGDICEWGRNFGEPAGEMQDAILSARVLFGTRATGELGSIPGDYPAADLNQLEGDEGQCHDMEWDTTDEPSHGVPNTSSRARPRSIVPATPAPLATTRRTTRRTTPAPVRPHVGHPPAPVAPDTPEVRYETIPEAYWRLLFLHDTSPVYRRLVALRKILVNSSFVEAAGMRPGPGPAAMTPRQLFRGMFHRYSNRIEAVKTFQKTIDNKLGFHVPEPFDAWDDGMFKEMEATGLTLDLCNWHADVTGVPLPKTIVAVVAEQQQLQDDEEGQL